MELRFVGPDLAELDRVGAEVLVASLFRDERPPRGVAGLFDWRSAGRLSRLMHEGFATGELGEVLMAPAKPSLPFEKVILFGAGDRDPTLWHGVPPFQAHVYRESPGVTGPAARSTMV